MMHKPNLMKRYESYRPFTQSEAWRLFKVAAIAEAFGWTFLLTGILINHFSLPGKTISISIGGQLHGMIFLGYFTVLFFTYPSLEWKKIKTLCAIFAGIIPYGSLLFERYASVEQFFYSLSKRTVSVHIERSGSVIAMIPSKGINWQLPTIQIRNNESEIDALERLLILFFGYVSPYLQLSYSQSNTIYTIIDPNDYLDLDLDALAVDNPLTDELGVIDRRKL